MANKVPNEQTHIYVERTDGNIHMDEHNMAELNAMMPVGIGTIRAMISRRMMWMYDPYSNFGPGNIRMIFVEYGGYCYRFDRHLKQLGKNKIRK